MCDITKMNSFLNLNILMHQSMKSRPPNRGKSRIKHIQSRNLTVQVTMLNLALGRGAINKMYVCLTGAFILVLRVVTLLGSATVQDVWLVLEQKV